MRLQFSPVALLPLLSMVTALIDIPYVDAIVQASLDKFAKYVAFKGAGKHGASPAVSEAAIDSRSELETRASPYWMEQIAHQGISAFGASGYIVFRNVKDYGAKGKF